MNQIIPAKEFTESCVASIKKASAQFSGEEKVRFEMMAASYVAGNIAPPVEEYVLVPTALGSVLIKKDLLK